MNTDVWTHLSQMATSFSCQRKRTCRSWFSAIRARTITGISRGLFCVKRHMVLTMTFEDIALSFRNAGDPPGFQLMSYRDKALPASDGVGSNDRAVQRRASAYIHHFGLMDVGRARRTHCSA